MTKGFEEFGIILGAIKQMSRIMRNFVFIFVFSIEILLKIDTERKWTKRTQRNLSNDQRGETENEWNKTIQQKFITWNYM